MKTQVIQRATKNFGQAVVKNSPVILTGLGVAGLISTTVLAVRATPKALALIEEATALANKDVERMADFVPLTKKEIIKETWKCYVPAAIMGTVTVACIVGANHINLRRNAALATVYSLSETALKEYQSKVIETIGENKERKIRDEVIRDKVRNHPLTGSEVVKTGKGETLCYDALSGRYFRSDIEEIRRVCNKVGRDLMSDHFITVNELYYELGLEGTKMGENVGFHVDDGLIEPDFSSQLTDNGTPCLVLDFRVDPRYGYNTY